MPSANESKLPLTSLDAGLLRQIAAKVDDDNIDVKDADVLRVIADSIDAVLEATVQAFGPRCEQCGKLQAADRDAYCQSHAEPSIICNCSGTYHHAKGCPSHCEFPQGCSNTCAGREGHSLKCCSGFMQ